MCHLAEVRALGEKPPDKLVLLLVAAALSGGPGVAVVDMGALLSGQQTGALHALAIGKFAPVVHGDALEHLAEHSGPHAPLQPVQNAHDAGGGVVVHLADDLVPRHASGEDAQGGLGALLAHYAVHLPVARLLPVVDVLRAMLDAIPSGGFRCFHAVVGPLLVTLVAQLLVGQGPQVPVLDVLIHSLTA